ncbi:MAG: hypothetical protein QM811_21005 [Pirellulales bacterium]
MCVIDALQDDIENIDSVLRMLNNKSESSWATARGRQFTMDEVLSSIRELIQRNLISPLAEIEPGFVMQIDALIAKTDTELEFLWFSLEPAGRDAMKEWWESRGQIQFPLPKPETRTETK